VPQSTYSLSFNGSTDRVLVGDPASLQIDNSHVTLSAWVKTSNAGSSYRDVLSKDHAFAISLKDNVVGTYDWANATNQYPGSAINDGSWHHIAVVLQAGVNNGSQIYVDGSTSGAAFTVGSNGNTSHNVTLGALSSDLGNSENFGGLIDDVALINSALSSTNIANIANGSVNVNTFSPLGLWRFEEGSGSTAGDSGSGGNAGTLSTPTWSSDVPSQLSGGGGGGAVSHNLSLIGVGA
jgi:hypothetical protein